MTKQTQIDRKWGREKIKIVGERDRYYYLLSIRLCVKNKCEANS